LDLHHSAMVGLEEQDWIVICKLWLSDSDGP
jgi:hypothetical protein